MTKAEAIELGRNSAREAMDQGGATDTVLSYLENIWDTVMDTESHETAQHAFVAELKKHGFNI